MRRLDLGAGRGLRQGEILALAVGDIDHRRFMIHVVRQLKIVGNRLAFALPKGRKTRDVPLPRSVANRITTQMTSYPPAVVTRPWGGPSGQPTTVDLIVHGKTGVALDRNVFNRYAWWPAVAAAGVPRGRDNGMHALRRLFALLDAGESIKALHLMPNSEDRTRRAIDRVFDDGPNDDTA